MIILASCVAFGVRSAVVLPGESGLSDDALAKLRGAGDPIYCQTCQECMGSGTSCFQDAKTCQTKEDVGKECATETGNEQVRWGAERCRDSKWGNEYCDPSRSKNQWMMCRQLYYCMCWWNDEWTAVECRRSSEELTERKRVFPPTDPLTCHIPSCDETWGQREDCTPMP